MSLASDYSDELTTRESNVRSLRRPQVLHDIDAQQQIVAKVDDRGRCHILVVDLEPDAALALAAWINTNFS